MFRTLSTICAILALAAFSGLAGNARAADGSQVRVTSAAGQSGGQVTVSLEGETGYLTFGAFSIEVVYDPAVVSAAGCRSDVALCRTQASGSSVRVAGVSLGGLTGHVEFGEITFNVVGGPGTSTVLNVQIVELADPNSSDISSQVEAVDGEITVAGAPAVAKGDADCDGSIDSVDGLTVLKAVAGTGEAGCPEAADVNCDGEADAVDALAILRYVAGLPNNVPNGCSPIGELQS